MTSLPTWIPPLRAVARRTPKWIMKAGGAWLRWFFRLGAIGKILATFLEAVAVQVAAAYPPVGDVVPTSASRIVVVLLIVLLVVALIADAVRGR